MKKKILQRMISVFLCVAMIVTYLPITARAASASSDQIDRVADPSTMNGWQEYFLPGGKISTENAGGVWTDKSVLTSEAELANAGITLDNADAFLVALSAMASTMSVTGMSHVPTDTMLVLDISASMGVNQNNVAEELIEAANTSIASLLTTNAYSRVGVVLYSGPTTQGGSASSGDAVVLLPLGRYTTGKDQQYLQYTKTVTGYGWSQSTTETVSIDADVVYEGTTNKPNESSKNIVGGTYMQKGIILAANQLTAEGLDTTINDMVLGTLTRKPVIVLMSDGSPTFSSTNFQNPTTINLGDGTGTNAAQGFVNQLTAAYAKKTVKEKYGTDPLFYTIGLGVSGDAIALSVLDPDNANASVAVNDFWAQWNAAVVGRTVTVQAASRGSSAKTVTKIDGLDQNYVDAFINVADIGTSQDTLGDKLIQAFADIVNKINLQSKYKPTLISQVGENHSGFISFVDKIGEYMHVTDVKGIIINGVLYSGADLASNFVDGGGNLGTFDNPTALGHEMVAAVRQRIGLATDDEARTLISLAYEYGQIRYNNANDYSNYIGWYADAGSNFLGFYQEGVTNITDPNAVYTIKSYGYLGVEHDSNMMYATVQVRHNIKTGEETVAFAVPAALIPVMTYNVSLDENGDLLDVTLSGSDSPIRLVYEVELDSHINEWNLAEAVSAEYLADPHNINADGSVNFYTNDWEHTNSTGYNTVNTYSYFNPSRQNEKYYYTSDAPVYVDERGTLYTGASAPDANGTFYRAYTVYEKDGSALAKKTVYRQLSQAALETAKKAENANSWYIPNGNVHVNLSGYTVNKQSNPTGTISAAYEPFVDVYGHNVNDMNHTFYVGATLGNNGKLTLKPQTGVKISKELAPGATATDKAFEFEITKPVASASTHDALLVDADGTERTATVVFDSNGVATVSLKAGQTLYIGDLQDVGNVTIKEIETAEYIPTVTVNGQASANPAAVTVVSNQLADVHFVNADRGTGNLTIAKEVDHDFGVDYQVPADKLFTMQVTLSGLGTANATFEAKHTNGAYTQIRTDANGRFTVQLAHEQQFEVFGLPAGTVATVVEIDYGSGFTPAYYDNGVAGDGQVTVVRNSTVSVIVVNDYQAEKVYPVNITVGGSKTLTGRDWNAQDSFTFKLQKLLADGSWQDLGTATATAAAKTFTFTNAFADEQYTEAGTYYYRIIEIEPNEPIGGVTYDKTVHSFAVIVTDKDMDGNLEIEKVETERPLTTVVEKTNDGWNVTANFTNHYGIDEDASTSVTIDIEKAILNNGGSAKSLAGYTFGLYRNGELVAQSSSTTERGFTRFVLTYNAEDMNASEERFQYVLKEIAPNPVPDGWTYSTAQILVTVVVVDNFDGTISAIVFEGEEQPANAGTSISATFTNTYDPADAELTIDFVSKELSGRSLKAGEFHFAVKAQDGATVLTGTNDAAGKVTFDGTLKFSRVGSYHYTIVETSEDGKGVTTDKTTYRIVVTVTDENGKLTANYVLVNAVGDSIVFKNTYDAADTTYTISGTKNLTGRVLINNEFTFVLTEALNAQGEIASGAKTYETRNEFGGKFTFPEITYTEAGTYYYVVSEKQNVGNAYGIVYDTKSFVVTVTVTDDTENGKLVASADLDADDIVFNNQYVAAPVSKGIAGEKVLNGKTLVGGQFSFELWQSNAEWNTVNAEPIQTVTNDGNGSFAFGFVDYTNGNAANFTETGTYYYLIKEVNGGATIKGIVYDDIVYRVRVEITDDLRGQLHATVHIYDEAGVPQESIVFRNSYEITGSDELTVSGTKKLNDQIPQDHTFEFELYSANAQYETNGSYIQKVTQDANGNFEFTISYKPEDISDTPYYYVVKEANGGQRIDGVTYDDAVYYIEVMVEDDGEGGVKSTAIIRKGEMVVTSLDFANTYTADEVGIVFDGEKKLEGDREVEKDDYTFEIFHADEEFNILGSAAPAVKNDADSKFEFPQIMLDTAKTYYFVVRENSENALNGVVYDTSVYHITVRVIDNGSGKLEIGDVTYVRVKDGTSAEAQTLVFENSYKATNVTVSIGGTKVLENRELAQNEFKFFLYRANASYQVGEQTPLEATNKADGTFAFGAITFEEAGIYYFVVSEDPETTADRVTNDTAVYYVAIEIKDDGNGKLYEASRKIVKAGSEEEVEAIAFRNVYTPKPEDITVEIGVKKTVVNKGSEKIGPEGFEFVLENIAANEKWTVKTDEDGNAVFTLTYTEADIGKTYTYKLTERNGGAANVKYSDAEYTITVTISLNENNALVAELTKNDESAQTVTAEFENVYDYTPAPEEPDSPKTGDTANLYLRFALLLVSGGGILSTTIYGKKNKMEKDDE